MEIDGIKLIKTCSWAPEQYSAMKDGKQVGYLRLRHGEFTVEYPDCGDELIYEAEPMGEGEFNDNEREFYLIGAVKAINNKLASLPRHVNS